MQDEHRPDPNTLLAAVQKEEAKQQRGKLKIFLGMAPGVGKTYAMLESAHQRLAEGVDVVVGIVETHKRAETEALVAGIPNIPRLQIPYHDTVLEEFNIDAVLARKPQLVLLDELAHTNAPGVRHPKRYQDVLELLSADIDVYTAVNVQHFESRADSVQQITGIAIRETVPDALLDIANDIELIDLPPEELLKRLAEGKVYAPDRAELAANNFFREGNLTALREMALRLTAERVDQQMQDYMQVKHIAGPWRSVDRLMVAISPSPLSERLIRWTRRTAYNLKSPWLAVYVETPQELSEVAKAQLARNISLVRRLDGEVIMTADRDPVKGLLRIGQQNNVTQIVVGKPARTTLQEMLSGGSLVNRLVRESEAIDVYVIRGDEMETSSGVKLLTPPELHSKPNQYILAVGVVALAVLINFGLINSAAVPALDYHEVALILLFVVIVLANFIGRGPIIVAAVISALLWDFLFIPPRFTLYVSTLQDVLTLVLYVVIALIAGNLTSRLRGQERFVQLREKRTLALYAMAHQVAEAQTLEQVITAAVRQIGSTFNADIAILLAQAPAASAAVGLSNGGLSSAVLAKTPRPESTFIPDDKELSVAIWAFDHNQSAGRFTDTLPTASAQYIPLGSSGDSVGVIGVRRREDQPLVTEQADLLETFINHIALAVEREQLYSQTQEAAVLKESERLYSTLLASVSNEIRTPLATLNAASTHLVGCDPEEQARVEKDIQDGVNSLNRLVDNLLDMTGLESGHLKLSIAPYSVPELVANSVQKVEKELAKHEVVIDLEPNLPLVPMDADMMERVLVNLLHNAAVYSPAGVKVRVTAAIEGSELVLAVADRGPGLPPADIPRVFDKFYRAPDVPPGGTGLGLSVSKGLVEAHGGTISAENRPTRGGARFIIRLPLMPIIKR